MKNYIISFVVLLIIILSFVLFNKNAEKTSFAPIKQVIVDSKINTVENKKPTLKTHNDKNVVLISKAPDDVAPASELQDLVTSKNVPDKYFHNWSDDEIIKDTLFDTWGKNLSEAFFEEHDNKKLLDRSRSLSDENDFLLKFNKGLFRGYVLLMKKDGSYGLDPQPFITFLNSEKLKEEHF